MPKTVISDTSCLIILSNIHALDILHKLYGNIITTTEVANEYGDTLPEWITIHKACDNSKQKILELQVDKGEASAIVLALENLESTLIIDDYKARKLATYLGIKITGTIGILIKAKKLGIIPNVKIYLDKILETNFRISNELLREALIAAGEE